MSQKRRPLRIILLYALATFITLSGRDVNADEGLTAHHVNRLGFEFQAYPTGIIPGFRYERAISNRRSLHFRLGYQEIRHQDFGVHDDERGNGVGFSIGQSWHRDSNQLGWSFGVRSDLWRNTLDWTDNPGTPMETSGTTDVLVLQPTVDVTYRYPLGNTYFVSPSLAAGFEINIVTDGAAVGQGFILLAGVTIGKSWK